LLVNGVEIIVFFFVKKKYYRVLELKNKARAFFELEQARATRVLGTALAVSIHRIR